MLLLTYGNMGLKLRHEIPSLDRDSQRTVSDPSSPWHRNGGSQSARLSFTASLGRACFMTRPCCDASMSLHAQLGQLCPYDAATADESAAALPGPLLCMLLTQPAVTLSPVVIHACSKANPTAACDALPNVGCCNSMLPSFCSLELTL